ncbi:MAG: lamin tail domain-containing protein [Chitinophagaceae bacterium]|uniref:lamin tail domain-containing protein n=1 Tax=unclassified Paraflavitalea TaxID=2798305 RepID=UPI003D32C3C9|nr:lamin tail domain-containing protein [Chitinophagaceae bacterium]
MPFGKLYGLLLCLIFPVLAYSQGRVVINEYLPWPNNSCGVTSEFVELTNMGPGPINIGCYVLTDGDFSVTIPANTILQPGQFYVISGQNTIASGCANINNAVTVDLNWTTCGCTSGTIPTTGDGFFTDGGSANEQVVLLNSSMQVIDAVVRALPAESSSSITTASISGCSAQTFNLTSYSITYETIGQSTGRGNSFARILDGDCGWVKDTQQSGGASNNTTGDVASVTATLSITQPNGCTNNGAVSVLLSGSGTLFPVSYILAYDTDNDNVFELTDSYTTGTDNSSPNVNVSGMQPGRYRLQMTPASGCSDQIVYFNILDCNGYILPELLTSFQGTLKNNNIYLNWSSPSGELIQQYTIEWSQNGTTFIPMDSLSSKGIGQQDYFWISPLNRSGYYRIIIKTKAGSYVYSSHIYLVSNRSSSELLVSPNPANNLVRIEYDHHSISEEVLIEFVTVTGQIVKTHQNRLQPGTNLWAFNVTDLPEGVYFIQMKTKKGMVTLPAKTIVRRNN